MQKLSKKICILIPCYNDWESLQILLPKIEDALKDSYPNGIHFVIVNDCSTERFAQPDSIARFSYNMLDLATNIGHQRAIAVGLAYVYHHIEAEYLLIMDADGEDKPEDVKQLIEALKKNPDHIIFAKRTKRREGLLFQIFYLFYKKLFLLIVGNSMYYGNFCILPRTALSLIVYRADIWNNFSGAVIHSKIKHFAIPLERDARIAGKSKMGFVSLIIHGLSAISVHIDTIATKALILTTFMAIASFISMMVVVWIKLFTTLAIPGWASMVTIGFCIIMLQSLFISFFLVFIVLSNRSNIPSLPVVHYKDYILRDSSGLE